MHASRACTPLLPRLPLQLLGHASPPHNRYEEALRKNNALDFDDLLGHTVALLRSAPAVQERYVRQFRCGGGCWVPVR